MVDGFLTHEGAGRRSSSLQQRRRHPSECPEFVTTQLDENDAEFACLDEGQKRRVNHQQRPSPIRIEQENIGVNPHPARDLQGQLRSYVSNLQRSRQGDGVDTRVAKSLAHFLSNNPLRTLDEDFDEEEESDNDNEFDSPTTKRLLQLLERAITQALRLAAESNNYKLILELMGSAILFANNHPILTPRIFGEAINALAQTQANAAKMKSMWSLMTGETEYGTTSQIPSFLSSSPTAFELNVLLKAMASRRKFKASVDVYRKHSSSRIRRQRKIAGNANSIYIRPDAYTVSTLFAILTDSITSNQKHVNVTTNLDSSFGSSTLQTKLTSMSSSSCWQWNAALEILDSLDGDDVNVDATTSTTSSQWNNHVYSSLLLLQGKAQDIFGSDGGHRNGPQLTMTILDDMLLRNVIPDEVTCALAIKAMGKAEGSTSLSRKWCTNHSSGSLAVDFLDQMKSDRRLPNPNQYCYSAAINACARSKDHVTALKLLEEMRSGAARNPEDPRNEGTGHSLSPSLTPPPNTWAYNGVLLSLDARPPSFGCSLDVEKSDRRKQKNARSRNELLTRAETAGALLEQMKDDHRLHNWNTRPDTVTFNTILGIRSFASLRLSHDNTTHILNLLDQMKDEGIERDAITYRNAILASSSAENVLEILDHCLDDSSFLGTQRQRKLDGLTNVFNTGLSFLASRGDHVTFMKTFALMQERNITMNDQSVSALIHVFGKGGKSSMLENLLECLGCSRDDATRIQDLSRFDIPIGGTLPKLQDAHYTEAIDVCLLANEFKCAYKILSMMRSNGIQPTRRCMESFAVAYAQAAVNAATKESKAQSSKVRDSTTASGTRADSAYRIAMALVQPRPKVLGTVARACALTGQWKSARALLKSIHSGIKSSNPENYTWNDRRTLENVKGTQTYLLRECAKQGNVEAALWYTRDIQGFAKALRTSNDHDNHQMEVVPSFAEVPLGNDLFTNLREHTALSSSRFSGGMLPQDWISLAKAASKANQWRVGVNTLQFIRPFVERTNPRDSGRDSQLDDDRYEQLTPALTVVVRCLESQSQYAWALRVIEDWIGWSGRKPRAEAVLSAMRVLSSNERGQEVKSLLAECMKEDLERCYNKKDIGYEEMLYIGAVTALHQNGLYDDADEVFISGVTDGFLPFDFVRENGKFILDLHGLNIALAHSAVRIALRQQAAALFEEASILGDMMIITGRGRNSAFRLRPILRPEVQRMLLEEFYPPLNTISIPGNLGALTVLADDVKAWQNHQQTQKGARMLDLATLLRKLANLDRLKHSIALKLNADSL